ncbi:MAG: diadenylate cyclase, partial [Balneolaceae bacterium]|nr:diadenylate cyclase [Balneolaceae bacterium]
FNTPSHQKMLKQYIAYNDGAVIINHKNRILGGQTHLSYSELSKEMIEAYAGTRHTSARRFSYDYPMAIIVTVSMDGPVSIFSDGCNVVTLDYTDVQPNEELIEIVREFNDTPASEEEYETQCSNCGKHYNITVLDFPGWDSRKEAHCYVCGNILDSANCFKIDQILLKKLG